MILTLNINLSNP